MKSIIVVSDCNFSFNQWIPFIEVNETETSVTICGPMAHLLKDLSDTLNFNFTLNLPRNETGRVPGDIDEYGNATGVLGMVINEVSKNERND